MKIIRTKDQPWVDALKQGNYGQRKKSLAGTAISSSIWRLAPGKKSFPFHMHYVTEEAMYVISGSAKVRTPEGETPIGAGDDVSFLPGVGAHQLINDGTEPLVYLGMSASKGVDIVEYPDTNKLAAAMGAPGAGQRFLFKKDAQVGYFDGDKDA